MVKDLSPEGNPQFRAIIRAIDEVSVLASLNPFSASTFLSFGPVNSEMQRKLVALGDMLDAFSRDGKK